MHITMIKKRLLNGEPCNKCAQAEQTLRQRGLWDQIDQVVWAVEGEPESEGMRLAELHKVAVAPFFIVRDGSSETVYTSALKFIKEVLATRSGETGRVASASGPRLDESAVQGLALELDAKLPRQIVQFALERYGAEATIAFSGAEDVVLIDMAAELGLPFSVFCLDTGRLHPETYRFLDKVRQTYGVEIELMSPQAEPLQNLVRKKGLFSFYEDGHAECCGVRKVEPLRRALRKYRAWITGQRRDQSPTRSELEVVQWDAAHEGRDGPLVKFNPLANQSLADVWQYIRDRGVPYNPLHDQGFISIGCEPCTRAIRPGEHERAGRWWWEEATQRECGLHKTPSS